MHRHRRSGRCWTFNEIHDVMTVHCWAETGNWKADWLREYYRRLRSFKIASMDCYNIASSGGACILEVHNIVTMFHGNSETETSSVCVKIFPTNPSFLKKLLSHIVHNILDEVLQLGIQPCKLSSSSDVQSPHNFSCAVTLESAKSWGVKGATTLAPHFTLPSLSKRTVAISLRYKDSQFLSQ